MSEKHSNEVQISWDLASPGDQSAVAITRVFENGFKVLARFTGDDADAFLEVWEATRRDAERYRWLRSRKAKNNRLPHITQYPYQAEIDAERVPQLWEFTTYHPERLDEAIDLAIGEIEHPSAANHIPNQPQAVPQTIDTAPKDGSHILAWRIPIGIRVTNNTHPPTTVHWFNDPDVPGFYTSVNERAPEHPFEATHWMPLPAGPSLSRPNRESGK